MKPDADCGLSSTSGSATLELSKNSGDHRVRIQGVPGPQQYREDRRPLASVPVHRLEICTDLLLIRG
ncbi:MAG: hypothetical protein WED01_06645 [Candidatus Rokuibacteriota bacterium]